jgi:hypothetical protein
LGEGQKVRCFLHEKEPSKQGGVSE